MFEWQPAENEVSAKLKRNFNEVEKQPAHGFVLGSRVISSENYGFLGWLNSMGTTRDIHDKLKNIQ